MEQSETSERIETVRHPEKLTSTSQDQLPEPTSIVPPDNAIDNHNDNHNAMDNDNHNDTALKPAALPKATTPPEKPAPFRRELSVATDRGDASSMAPSKHPSMVAPVAIRSHDIRDPCPRTGQQHQLRVLGYELFCPCTSSTFRDPALPLTATASSRSPNDPLLPGGDPTFNLESVPWIIPNVCNICCLLTPFLCCWMWANEISVCDRCGRWIRSPAEDYCSYCL